MDRKRKIFLVLIAAGIMLMLLYSSQINAFDLLMDLFGSDNAPEGIFPTLKNFKCDNKWAKQYQKMHAKSLSSNGNDRKFLIYHCLGHKGGCGGYGNRMAGLLSTFYLAVLLNRTFMIHWGGPELLDTFLKPNKIEWRYDAQKFKGLRSRRTYWGLERIPGYQRYQPFVREATFLHWIQHMDFDRYFDLPVEQIETLWYFAFKLWDNTYLRKRSMDLGIPLRRTDYPNGMMGCAMRFLFTKSNSIRRDLDRAKAALGKSDRPMIGIHIRTSDHHFGSHNPNSYRTRDPSRVFLCAQRVENALKRKNALLKKKSFTWFLAADDKKLKEQALKSYPDRVVTFDFTPRHLDLVKSGFQQIFRDLLLDQLMLLECDYFIGTSSSTFSSLVIGTRQFPSKSFVYGEQCALNENIVSLSSPLINTE